MTNDTNLPQPGDTPPPAPRYAAPAPQPVRRSRAPWIIGGAVAGVLVLGGAVGAGVLIGRSDDDITVQRVTAADTTGQNDTGSTTGTGTGTGNDSATAAPADRSGADAITDPAIAYSDDIELTGDTLTRAAIAALQAAGDDGVVTAAEYSDDPTHRYEVEVTRADGWETDVYLDENFQLVAVQPWHS
ncbi:hypothetical protein [Cellulomonas denverensis]|uniref:PepSY domain-containing protein n=1 Tax=Cellulomonas denverensis TaxID=264297 RepID=A0A7X6KWE4_9CELL|nr:hypothetical protein [Cellulomonas denverensis]NKY23209.1 hypothetical protein [Cellulomonas denverensis]